jgi:hypothetical protein
MYTYYALPFFREIQMPVSMAVLQGASFLNIIIPSGGKVREREYGSP